MESILLTLGWLAGALGALLTGVAGAARLAGHFWLASFQAGTVLLGGMALMIFGCLAFLAVLTRRRGA
jgi:hypothetical protein